MAIELLRWAESWPGLFTKPPWVVVDGAYAESPFLGPAESPGVAVVSRLRRDAASRGAPGPKPPGRRGPAPTCGGRRIEPAERGSRRRGWTLWLVCRRLFSEKAIARQARQGHKPLIFKVLAATQPGFPIGVT